MSDIVLSQSQIATYARCQRKYEFDYDWDVTVPESTERYLQRGNVLHNTIEDVCNHVTSTPEIADEHIRTLALERVNAYWEEHMDRSEYFSDAEFQEDYLRTRARIEAFFDDGPGYDHVRNSIATELSVQYEHNGFQFRGYIDNVVRTDDGLLLVDYKTSRIDPPFTRDYVQAHLDDGYRPDRVKPAVQAALYTEAIKRTDLYAPEMDVEFVFYELKKRGGRETIRTPDEVTVNIEGNSRSVTDGYHEQYDAVWELIMRCADGITNQEYTPEPFDAIYEQTCQRCEYRQTCPEFLGEEVSRV